MWFWTWLKNLLRLRADGQSTDARSRELDDDEDDDEDDEDDDVAPEGF